MSRSGTRLRAGHVMIALGLVPPEPTVTPEEARRAAQEVLGRPEYADIEPNILQRLLDQVFSELGRRAQDLPGGAVWELVGVALFVLLVVVAAVLLWRFVRRVRQDPAAPRDDAPVGRPARTWADEAIAHEEAGRWREALRCRHRELIADLADAAVVEEVPGRTASEYRDQVRGRHPDVTAPMDAVTEAFERVWYGGADTGHDDVAHLRQVADEVRAGCGLRQRQRVPETVS